MDAIGLPVAISAVDLLTSSDLGRLKICPAHECEWLFLDDSRNGTRRWCSMAECGNRAKARLHYNRAKRGLLAG
jgi:predicted RNA-binding Zn ribbon-like protein